MRRALEGYHRRLKGALGAGREQEIAETLASFRAEIAPVIEQEAGGDPAWSFSADFLEGAAEGRIHVFAHTKRKLRCVGLVTRMPQKKGKSSRVPARFDFGVCRLVLDETSGGFFVANHVPTAIFSTRRLGHWVAVECPELPVLPEEYHWDYNTLRVDRDDKADALRQFWESYVGTFSPENEKAQRLPGMQLLLERYPGRAPAQGDEPEPRELIDPALLRRLFPHIEKNPEPGSDDFFVNLRKQEELTKKRDDLFLETAEELYKES